MNPLEADRLPDPAPRYLRLLLGLPSDASKHEIQAEWDRQVLPLFAAGPQVLLDSLVLSAMSGGLPSAKALRVVAQTQRGQMLRNSIQREHEFRARMAKSAPPFAKSVTRSNSQPSAAQGKIKRGATP